MDLRESLSTIGFCSLMAATKVAASFLPIGFSMAVSFVEEQMDQLSGPSVQEILERNLDNDHRLGPFVEMCDLPELRSDFHKQNAVRSRDIEAECLARIAETKKLLPLCSGPCANGDGTPRYVPKRCPLPQPPASPTTPRMSTGVLPADGRARSVAASSEAALMIHKDVVQLRGRQLWRWHFMSQLRSDRRT